MCRRHSRNGDDGVQRPGTSDPRVLAVRTGATSVKNVPADVLEALERGEIETATLVETLATDFASLAGNTFPGLPKPALDQLRAVADKGVTLRMRAAGETLFEHLSADELDAAASHASDIVRGWAAYSAPTELPLVERLDRIRPFAADDHFGVREWAWLSVRPSICADPFDSVAILASWAPDADPNIRRFASEATRPRGVWATHIDSFKTDPAPALAILDQLCVDDDDYVHRSVANWMRDASKTVPDWVTNTIDDWEHRHGPSPRLAAIRKRTDHAATR